MPRSRGFHREAHRRESGVALVLTLSLIVVATVIVTAFFFRSRFDAQGSAGYSSQVTAAKLAEFGSAQVVAAVLAEAEDGATTVLGSGMDRVFVVDDPAKMVVAREISGNLAGGDFGTLVKQSTPAMASGAGAAAAGIRVSDVPTYESAQLQKPGYRPLGGEFWGRPMLTRDEFSDTDVPNWVYVNGRGETVTSAPGRNPAPEDKIVGRYAFNVYDVGGLLDMNVAGFTPGSIDEIEGRKGNLVLADLGWLSDAAGAPLDVSRLNEWRYRPDVQWATSGGKPSDSLAAVLRSGPMFASLGKFPPGMDTIHGTTQDRPNQNAFLSRSDMLNYLRAELGSDDATKLLAPYLTHFTRDTNAPTYRWDWDAGRPRPVSYRNDSVGEEEIINAEIWDGAGRTLMPRRFALDQINLLKLNSSGSSPLVSRADDVKREFGLTWSGGLRRWVYDQDKIVLNSTGLPRFRTLQEVKDANETPNFFEVLQAAINVGSLGHQLAGVPPVINPLAAPVRHTDKGFTDPEFSSPPNNRPHAIGMDDSCVAYHVARIGAAVIDQWDEDSLPTELEVNGTVIFGVEDLPYLHGFKRANYYGQGPDFRITDGGGAFNVREGHTYLHPQVWNPHARPAVDPVVAKPERFRVVPYTETLPRENNGEGRLGNNPPTTEPNLCYGTDFGRPNIWPDNATYGGQHNSANGGVNYTESFIAQRYPGAAALGNLDGYQPGDPNPLLRQEHDWIEFDYSESLREPALLWAPSGNGVAGDVEARVSGDSAGTTARPFPIDRIKNIAVVHPSDTRPRIGFRMGRYFVNSAGNGDYTGAPWAQIDLLRFRGWAEYYTKVNFALQYQAPGSSEWKTYDIMYDVVDVFTPANTMSQLGAGQDQVWRVMGRDADATFRLDPRVERFGPQTQFYRVWSGTEAQLNPSNQANLAYFPPNSTGFTPNGASPPPGSNTPRNLVTGNFLFRTWDSGSTDNRFIASNHYPRANGNASGNLARIRHLRQQWQPYTSWASTQGFLNPQNRFFNHIAGNSPQPDTIRYVDPDNEARRASAGWLPSFYDGPQNPLTRNANPGSPVNGDARPIVLNRPFQSVAEMGYACRDLPWKSVDFWNANTGDNALLDYFCINSVDNDPTIDSEANQLMAGVLNLNSANPLVLEAVLRGASARADGARSMDAMRLSDQNFSEIATALSNWVDPGNSDPAEGPFRSRAEVAGKLVSGGTFSSPFSGRFTGGQQSDTTNSSIIKAAIGNNLFYDARRTSLMRALVDSVGVRTWNLMIDVTAQSGTLPQNATQLSDFNVDGQARYWVFVAIDRFTGKVIDQRIETAN